MREKLLGLDPTKAVDLTKFPHQRSRPFQMNYVFLLPLKSLNEEVVPEDWRTAHIIPVFKKGSRAKAGNCRPISLTSVIRKVLERIIKEQITEHLDHHILIYDTQHGFRKGRSCTTNLLVYLQDITKLVDDGTPVDAVYLDLAKAFDTVPHKRLTAKIKAHGVEDKALHWIQSWLADRKQKVITQGAESSYASPCT